MRVIMILYGSIEYACTYEIKIKQKQGGDTKRSKHIAPANNSDH